MKIILKVLSLIVFALFLASACNSVNPEKDGIKGAKMDCEMHDLLIRSNAGGEDLKEEIENLNKEIDEWIKRIEEIYKDDEEAMDKLRKAYEKAIEDC